MALAKRGNQVVGLDSLNDYYDVSLKRARLQTLNAFPNFKFLPVDLTDARAVSEVFSSHGPQRVVNLAAQVGVRYSIHHPHAYTACNVQGFLNILEACRHFGVEHLVYASSSSVYGAGSSLPSEVSHRVDHPISLYAATKKSNELMAHAYSHLYGIPVTGLRFFTVYGPWGRPDMAIFSFTRSILNGTPIRLFNGGKHRRDFTYIGDVVEGVLRVLAKPACLDSEWNSSRPNPGSSAVPYRVYNMGNGRPVWLSELIDTLEKALQVPAIRETAALQPGDVIDTHADTSALERDFGFRPTTPLKVGIARFVNWYLDYYGLERQDMAKSALVPSKHGSHAETPL